MNTAPPPSWTCWLKWLRPACGAEPGTIERLPRVVAEVLISRGDAVEIPEAEVPAGLKRRRSA